MPLVGPSLTVANPVDNPLRYGLEAKPDELALASAKTRMTWRQLDEATTNLARQYLALGLAPGIMIMWELFRQ